MEMRANEGKKSRSIRLALAASLAASFWAAPRVARAGTYNWMNYAGDNWSDPTAWDVGAPPTNDPTTSLVFGQGAYVSSYTATDDLPAAGGAAFTLNSLTFNTDAPGGTGSITIAPISPANVLTFSGSNPSIAMTGGGTATINSPISYAPNMNVVNSGAGSLTIGTSAVTQTFGNGVTFTNNGTGSLVLGDGVTYAGTNVTVNLANNNTVLNGSTYTPNFEIGNMSPVSGTLNISTGYVTFAGSTAGDLFGNSIILNVAAGGIFDFANNPETMGGITGAGQVFLTGANVTLTESGNRTFSGVFSGTGGVAQNVASVLTLSGSNIYSGTTTIEAGGTILAGGPNVLSPNSVVSIVALSGATLNLGGFSQTIGGLTGQTTSDTLTVGAGATLTINGTASESYNGAIIGQGSLAFGNSASTATVQNIVGTSTYTGTTTVHGGTLRLGAGNLPGGAGVVISAGGTLDGIFPANASFTAPLSGTGTFMTEGPGTLTFSASNAGANLSGLTIIGGGIVLDDSTNNGNQIGSNATLTLGSGTLSVNGNASNASTQTFNGLTLQGAGSLTVTSGNGQTATVNLGAISRATGASGTVNFGLNNVGGSSAVIITTTANNSAGVIGGFATVNGTDWAVANGTGPTYTIGALAPASYTANSWTSGTHTDVTTSFSATGATTNDVRFNTPAADTVTLSGTNALTGGGILVTPNVGAHASAITAGTLSVPTGQDLILNQYNTGGALAISSVIANAASGTPVSATVSNLATTGGSQTLTLTNGSTTAGLTLGMLVLSGTNFPVADNAHIVSINSPTSVTIAYVTPPITTTPNASVTFTPETNVVKSGPGSVTLSGVNTFAGLVSVNQGILTAGATTTLGAATAGANGTSSIYFNGGTVEFTATFSPGAGNQPWIFGPEGGTAQTDGSTSVTRTGFGLYGTGMLTKTGTGTLSIGSDSSPFTGAVIVNAGTLKFTSSQIKSAGNVTISPGGQYQINDNGAATFGFATGSVMSLNGNGPSFGTNTTPGAFAETVQSPGPGPTSTLGNEAYLAGDSRVGDYSATFSGTLYFGATVFSNPVIGPGALIKDGPGTLTLSNASNAYGSNTTLDGTIISNGTLALGVNNAIPTGQTLQFGEGNSGSGGSNNNSGTLDLAGFKQTVAGLVTQGGGTAQQIINSSTTAASTLAVNYSGTTPDVFSGQIGGGTQAAPANNNIALTTTGSGTLTLPGSNTYSGATQINAGSMLINASLVNGTTGAGSVSVAAGASLGGTGSIALASGSSVSIASNATLSAGIPGATGNIFTVTGGNGVTLASSATFAIKTAASGTNDALSVTGGGNLTLASGDSLSLTSTQTGSFTIASVTGGGSESGTFATVMLDGKNEGAATITGTSPDQFYGYPDLTVEYNAADPADELVNVTITNVAVPEPASVGVLAVATLGLLQRRRRRSR
jgi:fibronectin-binding autotransporter adhesin